MPPQSTRGRQITPCPARAMTSPCKSAEPACGESPEVGAPHVEEYGQGNDAAQGNVLPGGGHRVQVEAVLHHHDDGGTHHGGQDMAVTASQARAAYDRCTNRLQLRPPPPPPPPHPPTPRPPPRISASRN